MTGGINEEVMKLVGEALENKTPWYREPHPVIGIVPWGCIKNRDELINEKVSTFTGNVLQVTLYHLHKYRFGSSVGQKSDS